MKILYVTTVGLTMTFFSSIIRELLDKGHTVDIACNESDSQVPDCYRDWGCGIHRIDCVRTPFAAGNARAVGQIRRLVRENGYGIVHCHTPIAAACTRLACKDLRKEGVRVFYTAHGFHFYKGAPLKSWLLYYPIEKLCAHFTDTLITINREDYALAKRKMKARQVVYVPGVGIDVDKFRNTVVDRPAKRKELGIPEDAFLLLSVGELNENKNHQIVIRTLAELNDPSIHYAIAGNGALAEYLTALAEQLGVAERVHLLGYRRDVAELYKTADVDVFPSIREGLGLAAIEGMAAGMPLICSDNRGTRDYAVNGMNALVCGNVGDYAEAISRLRVDHQLREELGRAGSQSAERFSVGEVNREMLRMYGE